MQSQLAYGKIELILNKLSFAYDGERMMKYLKERLIAMGIFFFMGVLSLMLMQFILTHFTNANAHTDTIFSLCYSLGCLAAGFFVYYKLLIQKKRLSKQDFSFYAIKKGITSTITAYTLGILCTIIFAIGTFAAHAGASQISSHYGLISTFTNIIGVTLQKSISGFINVGIKQFALGFLLAGGAIAGWLCAITREKFDLAIAPQTT